MSRNSIPFPLAGKQLGLLYWSCCLMLIGRAWQYWVFPPSFIMGFPEHTNVILAIGFAVPSVGILLSAKRKVLLLIFSSVAFLGLTFHFVLSFQSTNWQWANFLEHFAQWLLPIALLLLGYQLPVRFFLKMIIAVTFIGHGAYALGVYEVPPHFIAMVTSSLPVGEGVATILLFIVGLLDFLAAAALFAKPTEKAALWYMVVWGFLTAFARLYANLAFPVLPFLSRWLFEFLVRTPHFTIPLALLLSKKEKLLGSQGL